MSQSSLPTPRNATGSAAQSGTANSRWAPSARDSWKKHISDGVNSVRDKALVWEQGTVDRRDVRVLGASRPTGPIPSAPEASQTLIPQPMAHTYTQHQPRQLPPTAQTTVNRIISKQPSLVGSVQHMFSPGPSSKASRAYEKNAADRAAYEAERKMLNEDITGLKAELAAATSQSQLDAERLKTLEASFRAAQAKTLSLEEGQVQLQMEASRLRVTNDVHQAQLDKLSNQLQRRTDSLYSLRAEHELYKQQHHQKLYSYEQWWVPSHGVSTVISFPKEAGQRVQAQQAARHQKASQAQCALLFALLSFSIFVVCTLPTRLSPVPGGMTTPLPPIYHLPTTSLPLLSLPTLSPSPVISLSTPSLLLTLSPRTSTLTALPLPLLSLPSLSLPLPSLPLLSPPVTSLTVRPPLRSAIPVLVQVTADALWLYATSQVQLFSSFTASVMATAGTPTSFLHVPVRIASLVRRLASGSL